MPYITNRPQLLTVDLNSATPRKLARLIRTNEKGAVSAAAWHEAAHAVVGVRLGMTLRSIDIRARVVRDNTGNVGLSSGYTAYVVDGLAERSGAAGAYRARAVFAAAGVASELTHQPNAKDTTAYADDLDGIVRYAKLLGIPEDTSSAPSQLAVFVADVINEAMGLLEVDNRVAWMHVRSALAAKKSLTPENVVALMNKAKRS